MISPPLPLDQWRRWVEELDPPCAFVCAPSGTITEIIQGPSFSKSAEAIRVGSPFPVPTRAACDRLFSVPFPFLGEEWHWVGAHEERDLLLSAFGTVGSKAATPFFILDGDHQILSCNSAFRAVFPVITPPSGTYSEKWTSILERGFAGEVIQEETDTIFHRRMGTVYRLILIPVGPEPRYLLGGVWDITEAHRAQEALCESETRFSALFQAAPEGLATLSEHGFILQANRLVCQMSGVPLDQLRSKHILTFFPEEERPRLAEAFRHAAQNECTVRTDMRYRHPELGESMHLFLAIVPLQGLGAERFLLLLQDRTRLQLLGAGSNRGEQRYEALFQDSPDAIFTCLLDGTLLTFNKKAAIFFGWDDASIGQKIGLSHAGGIPWSLVRNWVNQIVERARSEKASIRTSCALSDASGLKRTFLVFGHPYWDAENRPIGLSVHLHDETENHILQERLAESREQFRSLVEYSSDLVFQTTPDWRVLYVNPAVKGLFGVEPDALLARRIKPSRYLSREHWRKLRRLSAETIQRKGIVAETLKFRRQDGTEFWGRLSLIPIIQQDRLRTVLGLLRDVDDLFQAQARLEDQAYTLRQTVRQLEDASRLQEQFVANVTHELRTPLTAILVTSEVLERQFSDATPAAQRRQVGLIRNNALLLQEQINDLLDLAKLKQGKYIPMPRSFRLEAVVTALRDSLEPLFTQKGLSFEVRAGSGIPETIKTDEVMLRKILLNLLSNACKFTEKGGVCLEIQAEEQSLLFRITDTGVGIEFADIPKIFEEFRQLDSSDARRQHGTGLGLSIADQFTALLGGRIEVASTPGYGSVFCVILPFVQPLP